MTSSTTCLWWRPSCVSSGPRTERRAAIEREKARLRQEAEERRLAEERRIKDLLAQLECWRLARDIRAYVTEALDLGGDFDEELRWALRYADHVDPLEDLRNDVVEEGEG